MLPIGLPDHESADHYRETAEHAEQGASVPDVDGNGTADEEADEERSASSTKEEYGLELGILRAFMY